MRIPSAAALLLVGACSVSLDFDQFRGSDAAPGVDAPWEAGPSDAGPPDAAVPETVCNGVDDDGDGEIDDGIAGCDAVVDVAAGFSFTCAVRRSGSVFCWGKNDVGQLGREESSEAGHKPLEVTMPMGVTPTDVEAGDFHACAIGDGELVCWGLNQDYQLGLAEPGGDAGSIAVPTRIETPDEGVMQVALGARHSCILTVDHHVRCVGSNAQAQCGHECGRGYRTELSSVLEDARGVTAGSRHTCALVGTQVRCWGDNDWSQVSPSAERELQVDPIPLLDREANAVVGGGLHTCAPLADDALECWGKNEAGQVVAEPVSDVAGARHSGLGRGAMAAGLAHTCAERVPDAGDTTGHGVDCWGSNARAQLGSDSTADRGPHEVPGLTDVDQLSLGDYHSCARVAGEVFCWGDNEHGQLGRETLFDGSDPMPGKVVLPSLPPEP